ncbi:hypothetical protein, partial [Corynebacterium bovis]
MPAVAVFGGVAPPRRRRGPGCCPASAGGDRGPCYAPQRFPDKEQGTPRTAGGAGRSAVAGRRVVVAGRAGGRVVVAGTGPGTV